MGVAREGLFGTSSAPFLGYLFLLEDQPRVTKPVGNKAPHFPVDSAFRGEARKLGQDGLVRYEGVSYSERYELLCRRLVLERMYTAACFLAATNEARTRISQPAQDLTFHRFVGTLRGHVLGVLAGERPALLTQNQSEKSTQPSDYPGSATLDESPHHN